MELTRRLLHMDGPEKSASKQVVLEDNVIIPDSNKDADRLLLDRGEIAIEEMMTDDDCVRVKGALLFRVLYFTEGTGDQTDHGISCMKGRLPFEEKLQMEGLKSGERVWLKSEVEELHVGLINSRKLNVRAIVELRATCAEMTQGEIPVALSGEEGVEYRKRSVPVTGLVKKEQDLFRMKEEVEIPGSYPNIQTMIYWDASPGHVEFRTGEDQILVQGELKIFCMYLGDGESGELYHYETVVPFTGSLDCSGVREGMLLETEYEAESCELTVRPDYDGEERILGIEMALRLSYSIYEEDAVEMISDVYGVTCEVDTVCKPMTFRRLLQQGNGKCKLSGPFKCAREGASVYRVIHSSGELHLEGRELTENGILLSGRVCIRLLYEDSDETKKFDVIRGELPFEYLLETDAGDGKESCFVSASLEQLAVSVIDTDEVDVKCVIFFNGDVFQTWEEQVVEQLTPSALDTEKQSALPGIAVYRIREGESLWDIGKRYYVPVDMLMQTNDLTTQEVRAGDKILIVR